MEGRGEGDLAGGRKPNGWHHLLGGVGCFSMNFPFYSSLPYQYFSCLTPTMPTNV